MNNTVIHINDVSDGNEVAEAIAGLYVNSLTTPGKKFYEIMLKMQESIRYDFTMLCFEWFNALSGCKCYDGRNEASVIFARRVSDIISDFDTDRLTRRCENMDGMDFDYRNDFSAALLFEQYLHSSESNDGFIRYMLNNAHKTNQQSFSRLCCGWLEFLSETKDKKAYVRMADAMVAEYKGFPFV